jgi:MFS family permease
MLIVYELRRDQPLIEMRCFRSISFSGAAVLAACVYAALGAFLLLNTFYLQDARGMSAFAAGRAVLPLAAATIVFSPLSGRLVAARGGRWPVCVGGCALATGGILLGDAGAATPIGSLVIAYVAFGAGFGMVNPAITSIALAGMPSAQAGVAGGITATARQLGLVLGVALAGAIARVDGVHHGPGGYLGSANGGWWVVTACGIATVVVGLTTCGRAVTAPGSDSPTDVGPPSRAKEGLAAQSSR